MEDNCYKGPEILAKLRLFNKTVFLTKRISIYSIVVLGLLLIPIYFKTELKSKLSSNNTEYTVESVIDGDTVILEGVDTHVRYLGIDTPEIPLEDSPGDPFSLDAKNLNEILVAGKRVKLEFDKEKYDEYGRMLAYVFADGVFVNGNIARNGLARAFIIKPNDKYANVIYQAQVQAKRERKGIWGNLSNVAPHSENKNFIIEPSQASRYIGQRVVVSGKIRDFRKSEKVLSLKIYDALDIVIFSGDWENFKFFDINPEKYYLGKQVEVIGRVKVYKGKPQIVISHPISIRSIR